MSLLNYLTSIPLFFSTLLLWKPQDSTTTYILIWILRGITFSLLFRSFLGPTILRLLSKRLRVQSVSLRSIRGIYFRAGNGILHINRVGLSYHKPSALDASRFSIRVEGFRLELIKTEGTGNQAKAHSRRHAHGKNRPGLLDSVPILLHVLSVVRSIFRTVYKSLEPYVRPAMRTAVVSALRVLIRALPALTQVLDLNIDSAIITSPVVAGAELVIRKAKFHTHVTFTQLDNSKASAAKLAPLPTRAMHRRFASVANFNTRVKNSLRRTWDKAWGSTQVRAAVSLHIQEVLGVGSHTFLKDLQYPRSGMLVSM
jgi:hypothetical protein